MRLAAIVLTCALYAASPAHRVPGTIIVDASEFYDQIPLGDTINVPPNAPWMFNNSVLNMGSKEDAVAKVAVEEAGDYRLFVRSQGTSGSSFKVAINGRLAEDT